MNENLEYYKIFYYVAKTGRFTLAAKELCISQPAVSQAVKQLEQDLKLELFKRTSKGVTLTQAGKILYQYVGNGYEMILSGEQKIKELTSLDFGEIRIGASDMTLQYYLLPYLEEFHQRYPNIKVHVTNAPTPQTIEHLSAGRIDFGIVTSPLPRDGRLKIKKTRNVSDIFIAGPKFEYLKDATLDYRDLEQLPMICLEQDTSTRKAVDAFLAENDVVLTPEFELATSNMIVQFVVRNLGIGSVMADFALPYLESGQVFQLNFSHPIPEREMYVISDSKTGMSIAAQRLMELLD
jgi:DNA-binding transcriptional LysR family regulator